MATAEEGPPRKKIRLRAHRFNDLVTLLRRAAKEPMERPQPPGVEPTSAKVNGVERQWLSSMVQHALIQLRTNVEPDDTDVDAFRAHIVSLAAANQTRHATINELKMQLAQRDKSLAEAQAKAIRTVKAEFRRRMLAINQEAKKATEVEVSGLSKGLDEVEGRKKELEEFNTERAHKVADDMSQTMESLNDFTSRFEKTIGVVSDYMTRDPSKLDVLMKKWKHNKKQEARRVSHGEGKKDNSTSKAALQGGKQSATATLTNHLLRGP